MSYRCDDLTSGRILVSRSVARLRTSSPLNRYIVQEYSIVRSERGLFIFNAPGFCHPSHLAEACVVVASNACILCGTCFRQVMRCLTAVLCMCGSKGSQSKGQGRRERGVNILGEEEYS